MTTRIPEASINTIFINRWSPRAFDPHFTLEEKDIETLIEAARWSPSCFNEQPWRFIVAAKQDDEFDDFIELLVPANQKWAKDAALIGFLVAKKDFTQKDSENKHARFDSGAAWMALTLQARSHGLHTHGMAGINYDDVYDKLEIDKNEYDLICAFAVGQRGDKDQLPEKLKDQEEPNNRKALEEIYFRGKFGDNVNKDKQ